MASARSGLFGEDEIPYYNRDRIVTSSKDLKSLGVVPVDLKEPAQQILRLYRRPVRKSLGLSE
jgi:hypothetical protein